MARKAKRDLTMEEQLARGPLDLPFLMLVLLLLGIGLVMLFSASYYTAYRDSKPPVSNNPYYYIIRQALFAGAGVVVMYIISRINGFTYVQTQYDYYTGELKIVKETPFSDGERAKVRCYGADDVNEGVAIMRSEKVDVSITGNSTNPTRFQHPVAGTYKKWCIENGKKYFSVASGGGTGRTLHPDNVAAGPASYGMTDTMGRMHSDAQFAGSSSVPAHVEMMG